MITNKLSLILLTAKTILTSYKKFFMSAVGVAIGTVSILLINMFSNYTIDLFNNEMTKMGIDGIMISINNSSITQNDNYINELSKLYCVKSISPYEEIPNCNTKDLDSSFSLVGVDKNFLDVYSLKLKSGSNFDVTNEKEVCIIDSTLSQKLLGTENGLGRTIEVNNAGKVYNIKIIGITEEEDEMAETISNSFSLQKIYVPINTLSLYKQNDKINRLILTLDDNYDLDNAISQIEHISYNHLGTGNFYVENLSLQKNKILGLLNIVKNCLFIICFVSVLVSATNIFNIMLMKVNDHKREIGIKKAIGATDNLIILDFLCESSIIFLCGCIIGIIISLGIYILLKLTVSEYFTFDYKMSLLTLAIGLLLGILSGVYPALKAARLKPVDTIYH